MLSFTCSRDTLLTAIGLVNKAVPNRTTSPILECILIVANENELVLTANNLDMGIQTSPISAEIKESGAVALESRIFSEIIRKSNGDQVYISVNDKFNTLIQSGGSKFQIPGMNPEEFQELPKIAMNNRFVINQGSLKNMIRQTIFSISQDESKGVLLGELFEFNNNQLAIVSVDGFRISYRIDSSVSGNGAKSIIIPGKTLIELNKILPDNDDEMSIYITDKHVLFDLSDCIVVSRLIEGEFINYSQSFPDEFKTQITIDRQEFIQSLDRASLFSRENNKTPVKLDIQGTTLTITANSEMGMAEEIITVELEGFELAIAFNPKYLMDALRVIDDEKVVVEFNTPLSPCTIKPIENGEFKYLILPLRI